MGIYKVRGKIVLGDETNKIILPGNLLFVSRPKSFYFFFPATTAHFRDKVILWGS
jgi:hypothetical protein